MRWFVGRRVHDKKLEAFICDATPDYETHGDAYLYCIGPFKTKRGAMFLERYPYTILQTVDEIEKFAAKEDGKVVR